MSYEIIVMRFIPKKLMKLLSSDDDKRVIMTDGIHTLAYGHKNLKNCNKKNEFQYDSKYFS